MKDIRKIKSIVALVLATLAAPARSADIPEQAFANPPLDARLHAYWWWLNGNVTKEAITRDLEAMREKGFGGALIMDAGGAEQDGNRQVPHGPDFGSPEWRGLYRHALQEAARLKLELALNIQSGWNLGGPGVTAADAAKILCWTKTDISGPGPVTVQLPPPESRHGLLGEVAVVAIPGSATDRIANWDIKALRRPVAGANHDTSFLIPGKPEQETPPALDSAKATDLSGFVDATGRLNWTVPAGNWHIYRFCHTVAPAARVSTSSDGWKGLALDPMDAGAFQRYWDSVIEPLMQDTVRSGGNALKYLHTDSWEIEPFNWTARLPEDFKKRCGYDMIPWLPVLAGGVVGGVEASERFLHDYRKTVAALVAESYYGTFLKNAHRHGLQVRAESGGPHGVPIDAQHCLGMIDAPMSEFWASSWRHRVKDEARFFVKQPASAAHTYGKKIVSAEGFTTIGPHWQETVWDNLKPNLDRALCEGLNQLVWTLVTCSPQETGMPGQEMFPGTHFNPNSTWWRQSEGFLSYINRCQWMLRQGHFVADVLYYYGDHAPNFAGLKAANPAQLPAGYDYDVATEHVILERLAVKDGRMVLPDGMSYAALVLAPHRTVSLPVLRKLCELAEADGTIIGPSPDSSSGLVAWQDGDKETTGLIEKLWGGGTQAGPIKNATASEWLKTSRLAPDFGVYEGTVKLDYIHRRSNEMDIYFVANPEEKPIRTEIRLRVTGKAPELWDPRDGTVRPLPEWRLTDDGGTVLPIELDAFGSTFLVFRKTAGESTAVKSGTNFPPVREGGTILGPWQVSFDPAWFYPDQGSGGQVVFETLQDWTRHPADAVRHFSGTAIYRNTFDASPSVVAGKNSLWLSLGKVREMARVKLNGRDLGIAWCPPWRVRIPDGVLLEKANRLEIEVVNFWPNRLIGDSKLPPDQRRTRTNITKFENPKGDPHYTGLMPSGLIGPVSLVE